MKATQLMTGYSELNAALERTSGLKAGDFSGAENVTVIAKDDTVMAIGVDTLTKHSTLLQHRVLCYGDGAPKTHTRDVFVVYSEVVGIAKGLYFNTHTVADVHFDNITGSNRERCTEASGGRTLQEMIQFLFHS